MIKKSAIVILILGFFLFFTGSAFSAHAPKANTQDSQILQESPTNQKSPNQQNGPKDDDKPNVDHPWGEEPDHPGDYVSFILILRFVEFGF